MNAVNDINPFAKFGLAGTAPGEESGELLQEDFLELMVTQLRNQDPFKPMENGDFLGQLAQFGTVSGLDGLEAAFADLASSLTSNQALQAAGLVDREVLMESSKGSLSETGELKAVVELPFTAQQLRVGVYNSSGLLVRQLELGPQSEGQTGFTWDGLDAQGQRQPPGVYELRAEASTAGVTQAVDLMISGRVSSVSIGGAGEPLSLEIAGLGNMDFSQVRKIG